MADRDRVYKCLNPVGIQDTVFQHPLAPRLDTLNGKTVYLTICGEPDITIPLEKKLKAKYPETIWKTKKTYTIIPVEMSEEERKTADAVILGVCW